ncbi:LacI family DNA-binding transcriptional regulator [Pseudarthrobacter defluvii]|jgi:LacI family transcriptional regulator|uniref:LacI family DNA-binding transcriptional regulator n=1 Tax=Pseudarthrobacter defluvii TaxID=410837 RepID=UPI002578176C|nr:LacI family DNA-binding transcriptional regulator [Pseudarthrobacter defluvii]WJH25359.1 LacI family DNA-binding transcriptional regulator [Pseudarthrobacter defluvii]
MVSKQDTRRATISEIAREAGVSVPTVSKVLNGHAHVAAETRARVEEIIAKRDYARRPAKRKQKAGLVDLVFPGLGSEWALEIIEGVERVAQDAGYGTVVSSLNLDGSRIRPWLANLAERKSDGLLMAVYQLDAKQIQRVKSLGIPVVLIDPVGQPGPDLTTVGAANWEGGYSATEHLLQLGHKRIAMIGGREDLQCSSAREDGYVSALRRAGIALDPALIVPGDFSMEAGEAAARKLLELPDRPTAIFTGNDGQALGAYRAARAAGLRIPEDLSIIGFDDIPAAEWVEPGLTTIRQPVVQMAETAMRALLRHLDGDEELPQRIELGTELVVRGSTAPPPRK